MGDPAEHTRDAGQLDALDWVLRTVDNLGVNAAAQVERHRREVESRMLARTRMRLDRLQPPDTTAADVPLARTRAT